MNSLSSMTYWYPKIERRLPTPRTTILNLTEPEISSLFETLDGNPLPQDLINKIKQGASEFIFPLFLRTDLTSGKHEFPKTCFVNSESELINHVLRLVEDSALKDLYINALVYREFIELNSTFKAFDGLPISKERRYFVDNGNVLCHHPYWPEDAIRFWGPTKPGPRDWKEKLNLLNTESDDEIQYLYYLAEMFSSLIPGAWSVDFAQTRSGDWLLIDAAEAHRSWHPVDCKCFIKEGNP